ncbi:hypothetical protein D3C87_1717580 [compost metagenome]
MHVAIDGTEQTQATTVGTGGELDVEALLQGLEPAQRHADAGIGLAGGDGFEQDFGGIAKVDQFHIEVVLLEKSLPMGDDHRRQAHRIEVDRQLQRPRRVQTDKLASAAGLAGARGSMSSVLIGRPTGARQ